MVVIENKQKLSTWRNLAHMTQEDFAEALGVDRATVSLWENGHNMPSARNRAKIEQVLKIKYFDDVLMPRE